MAVQPVSTLKANMPVGTVGGTSVQDIHDLIDTFDEKGTYISGRDLFIKDSKPKSFLIGVNLAGAEFGTNFPGVHSTDYQYPYPDEVDYFMAKGCKIFRIPFKWERMQTTLNSDLDAAQLTLLKTLVSYIVSKGARAILDPHNYGRYSISGTEYVIGSAQVPISAFEDFWRKLAFEFRNDRNVIFCLMNEPRDGTAAWTPAAQAAINAIRQAGAANRIYVPGTHYAGAHSWFNDANDSAMTGITDPINNFAFEAHQYLDDDSAGNDAGVSSNTVSTLRLQRFTEWCRQHGYKAHLGEFNAGDNTATATSTSMMALAEMVDYMIANSDVYESATAWAGGPWWYDALFALDPFPFPDGPERIQLLTITGRSTKPFPRQAAAVDIDFCKNAIFGVPQVSDVLSIVQAGKTYAPWADGSWTVMQPNTLRATTRGLLTEEERLATVSSALLQVPTIEFVTFARGILAPDGSHNAVRIIDNASVDVHRITYGPGDVAGVATGDVCSVSVFAKYEGSARYSYLKWGQPNASQALDLTVPRLNYFDSAGWRRSFVSVTLGASGPDYLNLGIQPDDSPQFGHEPDKYAGSGQSLLYWHPTIEKRPVANGMPIFPTSPIFVPKKAVSVTRAADVVQFIGLALEIFQGNFTFVAELEWCPEVAASLPILTLNSTVALRRNTNYSAGGDIGATIATAVPTDGVTAWRVPRKVGVSIRRSTGRVVVGLEGVASTGSNQTIPTITAASLGPTNCFIRNIQIYPAFNDTTALDTILNNS